MELYEFKEEQERVILVGVQMCIRDRCRTWNAPYCGECHEKFQTA